VTRTVARLGGGVMIKNIVEGAVVRELVARAERGQFGAKGARRAGIALTVHLQQDARRAAVTWPRGTRSESTSWAPCHTVGCSRDVSTSD